MNMVIRTMRVTRQRVPTAIAMPPMNLPVYVSLALLLAVVMAIVVMSWVIPVRQDIEPTTPFSDYATIWPGQPRSAVVAMGISCNPYNSTGRSDYCTHAPAASPFSLIGVTVLDGVVSRVDFAVREGALTVGELALLWGRPHIRLYRQSATLEWHDIGASATGWAENARFSYFMPVSSISFTELSS
jgi:hypothetical protein